MSNESNQLAKVLSQSEADPDIQSLFVDIFGEREREDPSGDVACFSAGPASFGLLISVAAPILYRWAMDTLNSRRAKLELDAVRQRIEMMQSVRDMGFSPEDAEWIVTRCLEAIAKRNKDDLAIGKLLSTVSRISNPAGLLSGSDETDGSV